LKSAAKLELSFWYIEGIWHSLAWRPFLQLKSINTQTYLFSNINSFLLNRQFSVKINVITSDLKPISADVPKGSKLGLMLFNIYVYDIPQSSLTNIAPFAVETTIFTESCDIEAITINLQAHLDTLSYWCKQWRIQINASKTTWVSFSLHRYRYPT